jgi:ABC-type transporter MlaC component
MERALKALRALLLGAMLTTAHGHASEDLNSSTTAPDELVETVFNEAVEALLDNQGRHPRDPRVAYELINDIFAPLVHYELMGQLILTRHWRNASDEQREAFIEAFSEYLIRTYAALLSDNVDDRGRGGFPSGAHSGSAVHDGAGPAWPRGGAYTDASCRTRRCRCSTG